MLVVPGTLLSLDYTQERDMPTITLIEFTGTEHSIDAEVGLAVAGVFALAAQTVFVSGLLVGDR